MKRNPFRFCLENRHSVLPAELLHQIRNVIRLIRLRKDTFSALGLQRQSVLFKKLHHLLRWECRQGTIKETALPRNVRHHFPDIAVVRQVAASLAGYA